MALRWDFDKDFVGKIKLNKNSYQNLYSGNALLIGCYEWTDDDNKEMYQLGMFFCDKDHMKNCLGLSKGCDNIYEGYDIIIELSSAYKETPTIVSALAKAKGFKSLTIKII